jgi:hypothetical protein
MKCPRCKKKLEIKAYCQACKNILLPYYENTRDWHLAHEMEVLQQNVNRYTNVESDFEERPF